MNFIIADNPTCYTSQQSEPLQSHPKSVFLDSKGLLFVESSSCPSPQPFFTHLSDLLLMEAAFPESCELLTAGRWAPSANGSIFKLFFQGTSSISVCSTGQEVRSLALN